MAFVKESFFAKEPISVVEFIKNNEINFFFAGGGVITLISESIEVAMHDLGKPWNVRHIPKHKI